MQIEFGMYGNYHDIQLREINELIEKGYRIAKVELDDLIITITLNKED